MRSIVLFFDTIGDGFFALDRQWRFTAISPRPSDHDKQHSEKLIGQNIWEKFPQLVGTELEAACRTVQSTRVPARIKVQEKSNSDWRDVSIHPLQDGLAIHWRDPADLRQIQDALFENMLDGYAHCLMLFENGRAYDFVYLDVNSSFERLTGLKNVVGKKISEVIPGIQQSNPALFEIYGRVAITGIGERFDIFVDRLNYWFSVSVYSPQREHVVAVFENITERKRSEQEIQRLLLSVQEEKERLTCLLNSIGDEVWFADTNKKFTMANPSALREFRLGAQAQTDVVKLAQSLEVYRSDGSPRPIHESPPLRALTGEIIREEEEIIRTPGTGELRHRQISSSPVRNASGKIIGSVTVARDITERKQVEQALRQSEEHFSMLADATFEGIVISQNGIIVQVNEQMEQMLGYEKGEMIGIEIASIIHPDDTAIVLSNIQARRESVTEHKMVRKDGTSLICEAHGKPNGERRCTSIRDITARKMAEEKLQKLNESLEQQVTERTAEVQQRANQLRALASELTRAEESERRRLAQILHDHLQQILVAAKMRVAILEAKSKTKNIKDEHREIERLLAESIQVSRSLTAELSPTVLYEGGLPSGLRWLARQMKEQHLLTVEVDIDEKANPDNIDLSVFLFQAVKELLFNVVKHAAVNKARVKLSRTNDLLYINVTDEGKGLDLSALNAQANTDCFGLFSLRERLQYLGGKMSLDSRPGKGTSITLEVSTRDEKPVARTPMINLNPRAIAPAAPAGNPAESKPIRVVLADDHKIVREGLSQLLSAIAGIEVVGTASDGVEAVEQAQKLQPDVIIMDVNMPRLGGVEATQKIISQHPGVRVIGLSMHEDQHIAEMMKQAGATSYLLKGGPARELIAEIRRSCSTAKAS